MAALSAFLCGDFCLLSGQWVVLCSGGIHNPFWVVSFLQKSKEFSSVSAESIPYFGGKGHLSVVNMPCYERCDLMKV